MGNILIIEDDKYFADDMKYFIEDRGHRCNVYNYVDDVMEEINKLDHYNIIILDIMMMKGEKMQATEFYLETGEILYNMIRKLYPNKQIIICTAKERNSLKIDFSNTITKFIKKPLSQQKLITLLNELDIRD